jgi:hypothetical protein
MRPGFGRRGLATLSMALLLASGACTPSPSPTTEEDAAHCAGLTLDDSEIPIFREVTVPSAVNFTYHNGEEAGHYAILEAIGGGMAVLDFDGDGRLDLFVTGGGTISDEKEIRGLPCKLYRNVSSAAGIRFEDVTASVGLDTIDFYSHGAAVADFDNDGWPDLLVTGWRRLALFHNEPIDPRDPSKGRKFVDVTRQAGLPQGLWTTSAAWGDLDGDGFADLYLCQYADWSFEHNHPTDCTAVGSKTREICTPKRFMGLEHKLFRNRGDGTFADVSKAAGLRVARSDAEYQQLDWLDADARQRLRKAVTEGDARFGKGMGALFVDINGDGKPDIYVANDIVDKFLYINRTRRPGKIQLEECGLRTGTALNTMGTPDASMGLDAADYNGSGRASLWVTNYAGELHALYRNECVDGREFFLHASTYAGIAAAERSTVGWGTGFLDLTHRGWEDIFFTAGDAYKNSLDIPRAQRPVLFLNVGGGKFKDISARGGPYFRTSHIGRGAVLADFDNDGRVDLAVSHLNAPLAILRNEAHTGGNHWLGVELQGAGHRDVVGARIVVEAGGHRQTRFAKGGGSYLSSSDRRHVIGLGTVDHIDRLSVIWPSGQREEWPGLALDRYWRLIEGQPGPECLHAKD